MTNSKAPAIEDLDPIGLDAADMAWLFYSGGGHWQGNCEPRHADWGQCERAGGDA